MPCDTWMRLRRSHRIVIPLHLLKVLRRARQLTKCATKREAGHDWTGGEERRRLEIVEAWHRAREAGVAQKDFCSDRDIKVDRLNKLVNWFTQRQKRGGERI
jgi:hypothetical protein